MWAWDKTRCKKDALELLELKNTIEMKNSANGLNSRLGTAEEKISERVIETY